MEEYMYYIYNSIFFSTKIYTQLRNDRESYFSVVYL